MEIYFVKKNTKFGPKEVHHIDEKNIEDEIKKKYFETIFNLKHMLPLEVEGSNLLLRVTDIELQQTGITELDKSSLDKSFGIYVKETQFDFSVANSISDVKIKTTKLKEKNIFRSKFNFEDLGVGGLDQEFADIFRVAFAARRYPSSYLNQFNIKHVRGMIFYGPPGTGKTLIARQLGKALNAKEVKVKVN
jgi:vesicle-fusing ATPase